MDKNAFIDELCTILDVGEVKDSDVLRDFEAWDSLVILSILALADSKFGFTMAATELKPLITVADLWSYFEQKRAK